MNQNSISVTTQALTRARWLRLLCGMAYGEGGQFMHVSKQMMAGHRIYVKASPESIMTQFILDMYALKGRIALRSVGYLKYGQTVINHMLCSF